MAFNAGELSQCPEMGDMDDVLARPKRGKDIKCFADLPPDVQQTIDKLSAVDRVLAAIERGIKEGQAQRARKPDIDELLRRHYGCTRHRDSFFKRGRTPGQATPRRAIST